jgi:hypothetical protein
MKPPVNELFGVVCICSHREHALIALLEVMVCEMKGCECRYPASKEDRRARG